MNLVLVKQFLIAFLLYLIGAFSVTNIALGQGANFSDITPFDPNIVTRTFTGDQMAQVIEAVNRTSPNANSISDITQRINDSNVQSQLYVQKVINSTILNLTAYIDYKLANVSSVLESINNTLGRQQEIILQTQYSQASSGPTFTNTNLSKTLDFTNTLLLVFIIAVILIAGFVGFVSLKFLRIKNII